LPATGPAIRPLRTGRSTAGEGPRGAPANRGGGGAKPRGDRGLAGARGREGSPCARRTVERGGDPCLAGRGGGGPGIERAVSPLWTAAPGGRGSPGGAGARRHLPGGRTAPAGAVAGRRPQAADRSHRGREARPGRLGRPRGEPLDSRLVRGNLTARPRAGWSRGFARGRGTGGCRRGGALHYGRRGGNARWEGDATTHSRERRSGPVDGELPCPHRAP